MLGTTDGGAPRRPMLRHHEGVSVEGSAFKGGADLLKTYD